MKVILSEPRAKTDQDNAKKGYAVTVTEADDDPTRPDVWLPHSFEFVTIHANAIAAIKDIIANKGGVAVFDITEVPEEP